MGPKKIELISIAIPVYEMKGRGIQFLQRCISSITRQIFTPGVDLEIIISDHSKTKEIELFCQSIQTHLTIKYIRNQIMRGNISANINCAISHCLGDYIKILFQDDMLVEDDYLEKTIIQIKTHSPDFIFTGALHTGDGVTFYDAISPKNNAHLLFGENTISSPSTLTMHKRMTQKIQFDENLKLLMDCDFYHNLFSLSSNHILLPNIHIANGVWPGQTHSNMNGLTVIEEVKYILLKYAKHPVARNLENYSYFLKPKDGCLAHSLNQLAINANAHYSTIDRIIQRIVFKIK